jgi:hypothetical protein
VGEKESTQNFGMNISWRTPLGNKEGDGRATFKMDLRQTGFENGVGGRWN